MKSILKDILIYLPHMIGEIASTKYNFFISEIIVSKGDLCKGIYKQC